jgi:hypothetical protein
MSEAQRIVLDALPAGRVTGSGLRLADVARSSIPASTAGSGENAATLASHFRALGAAAQEQAGALTANTQALTMNTASQGGGAASTAGNIAKSAAKSLAGGLTLYRLGTAIAGLFKKEQPEPPPLATYTLPPAIRFEGAAPRDHSEPILGADYGQDGLPRAIPASARYTAPPITIHVQAIDSRSFLDHSSEIAGAVREAILNSHILNDIVSEL